MKSNEPLSNYLEFITYGFTNPMSDADRGPWKITAKDVINGYINYNSARKTSQYDFDTLLTQKSKPKAGDILLTKDGTLGRLAIVRESNICVNQSVAVLRVNSRLLPEYLYYLLSSPEYQQKMIADSDGTTIKHIYITRVAKMEVIIPSIEVQENTVKILAFIDSRIELNNRMNKTLEEIAQTLFKRWFDDFEFPDENGNPYKASGGKMIDSELGMIPEGWNVSSLYDNIHEVSQKNKENKNYPVLSVVKEGKMVLSDEHFTKKVYSKNTKNYKIICRNQVGYNPSRANIGSIAILEDFDIGLLSPIYTVFRVRNTLSPIILKLFMRNDEFIDMIKHHSSGTTRQNFPFGAFKSFPLVLPPIDIQLLFVKSISSVFSLIDHNTSESKTLAQTRDTILPKLMSGEIRVSITEE